MKTKLITATLVAFSALATALAFGGSHGLLSTYKPVSAESLRQRDEIMQEPNVSQQASSGVIGFGREGGNRLASRGKKSFARHIYIVCDGSVCDIRSSETSYQSRT
ncbi:hypothetical protein, partial [Paraburkholderia sp. J11-2]|uniref:hypothetical protein n=1 Tax=Paraburkholderia sp. J11-2 TaxID=2805431 RepID=UPI002AB7C848